MNLLLKSLESVQKFQDRDKLVVMLLYKISHRIHQYSPFKNKHPIADYAIIKKQVEELVAEGVANKLLYKKKD